MKITTPSENIQAFGGLNFISNEFNSLGLSQLIDNHLGSRGSFAQFSYSDIIKNYWLLAFAGGDCAEDIQTHLKSELCSTMGTNVCSADTLLRAQKELATSTKTIFSKNNIENQINTNDSLNELNIKLLKKIICLIVQNIMILILIINSCQLKNMILKKVIKWNTAIFHQ